MAIQRPYIPETITVHLGPPDSNAQNVTLSFPDYIKNVASSEIYPTWPEAALRANIYAQISYALNRVYTEWYRSRGYNFDITNSTQYDQAFVNGRDTFENISKIVDDIFNDYIRRDGYIEPLFAQYCNGTTVTCDGLSQWGTVPLAEQGYVPYDILTHYYGNDIQIEENAPIQPNIPSYPGTPLRLGRAGEDVRRIQNQLNRISQNYPLINKINPVDGVFNETTESAVKTFQDVFNLTQDGIVGKDTWYRINFIYVNVKRLAELASEGEQLDAVSQQYKTSLSQGDRGNDVRVIQYYLAVIGYFNAAVPMVTIDGIFGEETKNAVIAFQKNRGLVPDGIIGPITWEAMYDEYKGIVETLPPEYTESQVEIYPGSPLQTGSTGEYVRHLQTYLSYLSGTYSQIPNIVVDGIFGNATRNAVIAFQRMVGLSPSGIVGPLTWAAIADYYYTLRTASTPKTGQFPGQSLSEGMQDARS